MISLKEKYADYFKIGVCANTKTIVSHEDLIKAHFNSLTCENEMKYIRLSQKQGEYTFSDADQMVDFAKKNHMLVRGHNFVWHNQTPQYIFENTDKESLLNTLRNHIELINNRYKDSIYCWDVVNEGIEDKTEEYLRDTPWKRILGEHYMEDVFRIAKEIMPDKQLFYNDYNEICEPKITKIIKAVTELLNKGVPIDGVGMQFHIHFDTDCERIEKALERYAKLGLRIHITEMDVSLYKSDEERFTEPPKKRLEQQAEVYGKAFKIFRDYKDVVDSVTLWGVADDVNWLDNFPVRNRKNWPLLFDIDHNPKEAFERITQF